MPDSVLKSARKPAPKTIGAAFLAGGGEMGRRMRALDWSRTALGDTAHWPVSLRTAARILLTARQPMFLFWGERFAALYNDAAKGVVSGRHPQVLGQPANAVWPELWAAIGARLEKVRRTMEAAYLESAELPVETAGASEAARFAISMSPVPDDDGEPGGVLCVLNETESFHEAILALSSELDTESLVRKVTDVATRITKARFGAFLHNRKGEAPAFDGESPVRIDDVTKDPRYGKMGSLQDMPRGHPPVKSYLAVPVRSRTGDVLGGLVFGHPEAGMFDERAERNARAIAAHAGVAIDNANLFGIARGEIEQRSRVEIQLRDSQLAVEESERLYRAIGESIKYGVWVCDEKGRIQYVSDSFLKLTGRTREDYEKSIWSTVLHPDEAERVRKQWKECIASGRDWEAQVQVKTASGEYRAILSRGVAIRDDDGRITGWAGMNLDIDRLKRVENELRELDQRKNEFLATLAHELRNPLAPIRNGLEIMRLGRGNAGMVEQARTMMERQLHQMVRLVDDLLDVSRVSRGKIELRRSRIELATALSNAIETAKPLIDQNGQTLVVELPEEPIHVDGDLTRLSQVFANLLNNAAKYTEKGGRVEVAARRVDGKAEVSVKDNGIGIPREMLEKVFDIFTQVDRSLEKARGGLGIGLSIARRLVEMHGGTIVATSEGAGCGSEFTVTLPAVEASQQPDEPTSPARRTHVRQRRILVADDNFDSATSLSLMLQVMGNEVRVAHDGLEALSVAESFHPDAVLLDIGMPRLNGYEVCRKLRESPGTKHAMIVALTGWGQPEDRQRSREFGFDHHLVKPVEPRMLEQLLATLSQEVEA